MSKVCVASQDAGLTKWKKAGVDQCSGGVQIFMREGSGGEGAVGKGVARAVSYNCICLSY